LIDELTFSKFPSNFLKKKCNFENQQPQSRRIVMYIYWDGRIGIREDQGAKLLELLAGWLSSVG
jgi:hypothetical protein